MSDREQCRTEECERTDRLHYMVGPNGESFLCPPCYHAWADGYEAGHYIGKYEERYGVSNTDTEQ